MVWGEDKLVKVGDSIVTAGRASHAKRLKELVCDVIIPGFSRNGFDDQAGYPKLLVGVTEL